MAAILVVRHFLFAEKTYLRIPEFGLFSVISWCTGHCCCLYVSYLRSVPVFFLNALLWKRSRCCNKADWISYHITLRLLYCAWSGEDLARFWSGVLSSLIPIRAVCKLTLAVDFFWMRKCFEWGHWDKDLTSRSFCWLLNVVMSFGVEDILYDCQWCWFVTFYSIKT